MSSDSASVKSLEFHPLTADRWPDLEALFGERGAYGGCWCMWWRSTRSEFEDQQGEGNRKALKGIVNGGEVPGILAYEEGEAVGWCSVAPRQAYGSLNRSRILKPIDGNPVWSIVCFFVAKTHRMQGLLLSLIRGAVEYAKSHGAKIIEAYPTVPKAERMPPVSSFMGLPSVFEEAGFVEVARPSTSKMIMRLEID